MSRQKDEKKAVEYDSAADHSVIEDVLKAIGPLIATAAVKAVTNRDKSVPTAEEAKDRAAQAKERSQELAEQAKDRAAQAKDRGQELAGQAKEKLAPVAEQAKERGQDLAAQAKDRGAHLTELLAPLAAAAVAQANQAKDKATPLVETATEKVQPHVETARAKVADELVPSLLDLLHQAEEHPAVSEATSRGKATVAALRGELAVPQEEPKRSAAQAVAKVAAAGAVLAAVAVAIRTFLGSKDDQWTAHQPSSAYVPGTDDVTVDDATLDQAETDAQSGPPTTLADTVADQAPAPAEETKAPAPVEETKVDHDSDEEDESEAVMADEGGITDDSETTAEDVNVLNEYGEGAYVGEEAPAEYSIKGNERSMKYHTPGSAGYDRTIPDVWFNSVEAAEKAGFTQAQR